MVTPETWRAFDDLLIYGLGQAPDAAGTWGGGVEGSSVQI